MPDIDIRITDNSREIEMDFLTLFLTCVDTHFDTLKNKKVPYFYVIGKNKKTSQKA